uniref:BTB domain-containing protein n=1 Tax=Arcella intermedia TaxID=1963864 RepID=A0A6B2LEM1_9EUKA
MDVGGKIFCVSLKTLVREECFFSAMFSGKFKLEQDKEDGSYFVDRSPYFFEYILDFMRTGKLSHRIRSDEMEEFKDEVMFYQIPSLLKVLNTPKVIVDKFSSCSNVMKLSEDKKSVEVNGSSWSVAYSEVKDFVDLSFGFYIENCLGHNDRIGLMASTQNLSSPLENFAIYLLNKPNGGNFVLTNYSAMVIPSTQLTRGDKVYFYINKTTQKIHVWRGNDVYGVYLLPSQANIKPAFGSCNNSSKVSFISKEEVSHFFQDKIQAL